MATLQEMKERFDKIADAGFYLALRVGFSFPEEELNALPSNWVEFYTANGLVVHDPSLKWVYGNNGAVRSSDIGLPDPQQILGRARVFGLQHGAVVSVVTPADRGRRSYGLFYRAQSPFTDEHLTALHGYLRELHSGNTAEPGLTAAEVEALQMQAGGLRLKQIAGDLGISESAVKARLNNAKRKLGARTLAHAASLAAGRRII
ncbi:LuxR family transcriptional regulator [Rhodobacter sp. KR11]|jgi:LuxR family transcriptional regulator|uniref:helix-turn-helix transcriptional regulator n=1 Tax=Rhodobacter sp. KR11 TaxID=2974588 RepID=UPI0022220973|nr:LuxR family transcriptional regulator [Rhodobacter sp. KR11]MCW1919700.1 LuxR family transcriptional regulator [Rhodobacter sp. KR11]